MADRMYTPEQVNDAEQIAKVLSSVPPEKKSSLVIAVNAFMAGLEAGLQMKENEVKAASF